MGWALDQARLAGELGDIPIGAVVLDRAGAVIAAGGNRREVDHDPLAHAEVVAMRAAAAARGSWRLDDCTLIVTIEPCTMCAGALMQARVERLVFGAWEPKTGAVGSLWDVVRDPRITHTVEVIAGVREAECAKLMSSHFKPLR